MLGLRRSIDKPHTKQKSLPDTVLGPPEVTLSGAGAETSGVPPLCL